MGSGVSYHAGQGKSFHKSSETWNPDENEILGTFQSFLGWLAPLIDKNFAHNHKYVLMICVNSWDYINTVVPPAVFCEAFFQNFTNLDPEACLLLCPRTRSSLAGNTRPSLLLHMIRFMLKIQVVSQKTKKHLRALGRRHLLLGIEKKHVSSFNDALMMTIAKTLNMPSIAETLRCWSSLLNFVTEQLYFDDIRLVEHFTPTTSELALSFESPTCCMSERSASDCISLRFSGDTISLQNQNGEILPPIPTEDRRHANINSESQPSYFCVPFVSPRVSPHILQNEVMIIQ